MNRANLCVNAIFILLLDVVVLPVSYAQQPLLQVTSPADGSLVVEGQPFSISVSADASVQGLWVVAENSLPEVQQVFANESH